MASCPVCGGELGAVRGRGRPRRYCSRACQARAYRSRVAEAAGPERAGTPPEEAGAAHLSLTRIVRAAIDVADRDGLDALHMRTLAAELGAGTMSLYRHVPGREALVDAMIEHVLAEDPLPDSPPAGWREGLEHLARRDWAMYARHPWILRQAVAGSRLRWSGTAARDAERSLAAFDGLGLPPAEQLRLLYVVSGYTQGLALVGANEADAARRAAGTGDRWWRARRPAAEWSAPGPAYPRLAALLADLPPGAPRNLAAMFEAGLATILDGIAAALPAPARTGARDRDRDRDRD